MIEIKMQMNKRKLGKLTINWLSEYLANSITLNTLGIDLISIDGNPYSLNEIRKELSRKGYMQLKDEME